MLIESALNQSTFTFFIKSLVKILEKKDLKFYENTYFLLDNLQVHYGKLFKILCRSLGLKLIFTSPYSPQYNPIELWFNCIK